MTRRALILIWLLCAVCALVALAWMACAIIAGSTRAMRIALGFDRLGNATAGGDDGEYISAAAGATVPISRTGCCVR